MCHYDFVNHKATVAAPVGHFTQIVWKASEKFGVGRAFLYDKEGGCVFVVARYKRPGNVPGQALANVEKGQFSPAVCRPERLSEKTGKGATLAQSKLLHRFKVLMKRKLSLSYFKEHLK